MGKIGKVVGISKEPHLYLDWSYDNYVEILETNPLEILNFFFNNKRNKKSLHYHLTSNNWITNMTLENYILMDYSLISIDFALTEEGFKNMENVFFINFR